MTDRASSTDQPLAVRAMPPTQVFAQRVGVLIAKAMISSVPLASLTFDIGQAAVDLANAKITSRFLNELGDRVEKLEISQRDKLKKDPIYEIAAHAALRILVSECNETVAEVLARAVAQLSVSSLEGSYKRQCARVLLEANEPFLHALQTNERFQRNDLSADERQTFAGISERTQQLAALLYASMPMPEWQTFMERLMSLGLIEDQFDHGHIGSNNPMVQTAPSTEFGQLLLTMCFEEVSKPVFGKFSGRSQ